VSEVTYTGRLAVYVDDVYRISAADGRPRIFADRAFLLFVCELGSRFEGLTLIGRVSPFEGESDYELPEAVDLVELPYYTSLLHLGEVVRALPGTVRAMWRGLDDVDIVWVVGPNPFDLLLFGLAALRRKRLALGVRQDTVAYFRSRAPGRLWAPALLAMRAVDLVYRLLAVRQPTVVVGRGIAKRYGESRATILAITVSLMHVDDIAPHPPHRALGGQIELLTVGRIDREKNPLLLVEALAELDRGTPGGYTLTWIGRGPLEDEVLRVAKQRGIRDRIELRGYVPFGPELFAAYRRANIFVHVALTEGVPQVIVEALALGTPVVATDVGGVREAFDGALQLVPPADLDALVDAVRSVAADPDLRARLAERGLALAREATLEREVDRVAAFLASGSRRSDR
jgi:glycosyltransferase involved in cell wall biosynthesis